MNNPITALALAAAITAMAPLAHATIVTSQSTARDMSSFIVNDSLNQRQWLAADATRGLTYSAAQAAVASGGLYAGWRIATTSDALLYQRALTGGSNCNDSGSSSHGSVYVTCSTGAAAATVFGESYAGDYGYGSDWDYVSVLGDLGRNVGGADLMGIYWNGAGTSVSVQSWSSIGSADYWAANQGSSFGFLLTRSGNATAAAIPEPGTLALAGLAVLGVAASRRRGSAPSRLTR